MRTSKFTPEQMVMALRQADLRSRVSGSGLWVCRRVRELRQLREENRRLKSVVADLTLDRSILQEAMRTKW